jgi:hypothetical protein
MKRGEGCLRDIIAAQKRFAKIKEHLKGFERVLN